MRYIVAFLLCTIGLGPIALAKGSDALTMTGVASYSELRKPYYIGALYLDQPVVSAGQVLSSWGERRMEIRITADRWTPRRFSSQWTQALILNVDPAQLEKYDDAFVSFNNLPRGTLRRGDQIVIRSDNKGRTAVSVNGSEMFTESKPGFFEVLLATWIGDKPPSTEFKQAILSDVNSSLLSEYKSLQPSAKRTQAIAGWLEGTVEEEDQVEDVVPQVQTAAVPATANQEKPGDKPAATAVAVGKSAAVVGATAAATLAVVPTSAAATSAAVKEPVATPGVDTFAEAPSVRDVVTLPVAEAPAALDSANNGKVVVAMAPTTGQRVADEQEPQMDPAIFRLQQETLLKLYRSSVIKRALRHVEYPKASVRRGQEGTVMLELTVNRGGDIVSLEPSSKSRFDKLNDAAVAAVYDAGILPKVPAGLEGEQVTVSIPVRFKLQ